MSDDALTKLFLPSRARAEGDLSEHSLVGRVVAGDRIAAEAFLKRAIPTISTIVQKIEPEARAAHQALLYVLGELKEDGYRRLRAFNGRASLASFLALVTRELLAKRAAEKLLENPNAGWVGFARMFERDIHNRIARRFPYDGGSGRHDDLYQDVCEKLVEHNCQRLRKYSGKGSFIGFLGQVVDHLLTDMMRREAPRQRLPAAIQRMPKLEQDIYAAIAWKGCAPEAARLCEFLRNLQDDPDPSAVGAALARVMDVAVAAKSDAALRPKMVSLDGANGASEEALLSFNADTPEDELLLAEEEREREALIAIIRENAETLAVDERLYLQVVFGTADTIPRREIAQILGCSVDEVDRLKQRAQRWFAVLRQKFENDGV
jgi:RNA polymerase primary sigma factor